MMGGEERRGKERKESKYKRQENKRKRKTKERKIKGKGREIICQEWTFPFKLYFKNVS